MIWRQIHAPRGLDLTDIAIPSIVELKFRNSVYTPNQVRHLAADLCTSRSRPHKYINSAGMSIAGMRSFVMNRSPRKHETSKRLISVICYKVLASADVGRRFVHSHGNRHQGWFSQPAAYLAEDRARNVIIDAMKHNLKFPVWIACSVRPLRWFRNG